LYIPYEAPSQIYEKYYEKSNALKLYVRRVLIAESFDDLMPRWLGFIKGIVDSDSLPLNVNREMLQQMKMIKVMSKKLVRKALEMIKEIAEEENQEDEDEKNDDENNESDEDQKDEKKTKEKKNEEEKYDSKYE
jgi:heat shock protein beta